MKLTASVGHADVRETVTSYVCTAQQRQQQRHAAISAAAAEEYCAESAEGARVAED